MTKIGVSEHVIADGLGVAEACAMTHHEPAIGADDSEVVGNILRVGRADTNVDQRYAGVAAAR